jgi:signal transduction histidine kinase
MLLNRLRFSTNSFPAIIIWLIFFSAISAIIFYNTITEKSSESKKLFADKKSREKDEVAETRFAEIENELTRSLLLQMAVRTDTAETKPNVLNQTLQMLQTSYFKKFTNDIFVYSNDSLIVTSGKDKNISRWYFIDAIENNGEYTNSSQNLFFINDNTGNYYYVAELPLKADSLSIEVAYIRLTPKRFSNQSIYPELLIDDELKISPNFENFDYAIYNDQALIERKGEYSYPIMDIFYVDKNDNYIHTELNGYDHLVYRVNDNKKVIVSEPVKNIVEPFSYFSYIFFFFILFIGCFVVVNFIVQIVRGKIKLREWLDTTLQNKIQVSVISLIVFAFVIMGIATILYITNQYNKSHRQRLLTKIEAVQTNIDYIFDEVKRRANEKTTPGVILKRITNRAAELSEIHDMDINLYSPAGELITSSQPDIFTRGLVSTKMNPLAYFKMTCDKETWYIQDESIGRLEYLSAYVPIMDNLGETIFYLNLPYFATEQNLKAEISSFMVALINVYVLLLVVASILAFTVAQSITRPLAAIAGTFKNIKLGRKNEPVHWQHKDEIGLLVDEYNTMIKELEKSAALLAKSERESAWRDMAKQVAHEIKNPLTPMRLSIQHLQRALQTNAPNTKELTEKVTKTLLEQIDNLSFIASEFSNFAIMPKANNERIVLNEVLDSVVHLFLESEEADISLELPDTTLKIYADKNQLIRVFNNLIKNAIQAIHPGKEGYVHVSLHQEDHRAVVKVRDNGIGIPESQREKVFVPNFTTKNSGMGIGLAMSKNIIESSGGYIWFESEENVGTTFYVEFPLSEN